MLLSKSARVIEFIRQAGEAGRSFTEIQRFVVEVLNGKNFDEKAVDWCTGKVLNLRRYRGYWCNHLLGGMHYGPGLLKTSGCVKNTSGRWIAPQV